MALSTILHRPALSVFPAFSSAAVSLATRSPINARQECAAASSQFAPLGEEVARPLGAPADRRVMGNLIALAYRCHGRAHRMCAAHSVVGPAYKGGRWLTAKLIIFNRHSSDHAHHVFSPRQCLRTCGPSPSSSGRLGRRPVQPGPQRDLWVPDRRVRPNCLVERRGPGDRPSSPGSPVAAA
jgi:hypothetical protein